MFSALQRGSTIHILEKGQKPIYYIGQVESMTQPAPPYQAYPNKSFINPLEYVTDIKVRVGNDIKEFKQVPSNANIVRFDNGNVVVSETRDNLITEVQNMLDNSESIVNSIPFHKSVIEHSKAILKELSPAYAKEQERDTAFDNLKTEINSIKSEFGSMKDDVSKILAIIGKDVNSKTV